jgi:hypothetical protein
MTDSRPLYKQHKIKARGEGSVVAFTATLSSYSNPTPTLTPTLPQPLLRPYPNPYTNPNPNPSPRLHGISSHFNVLNMPISTTAPIDAKTHV